MYCNAVCVPREDDACFLSMFCALDDVSDLTEDDVGFLREDDIYVLREDDIVVMFVS